MAVPWNLGFQGVLLGGKSFSEARNPGSVALSCEQTAVVLRVSSEWHSRVGLKMPSWQ